MLIHSYSLSSRYICGDSTTEEDKEEEDCGPTHEVGVDGVIIGSHRDPINPATKRRIRRLMTQ